MSLNSRTIFLNSTGAVTTAGKTFQVPTDRYWEIKSIRVEYIASDTVGNRNVHVTVDRNATGDTVPYLEVRSEQNIAASGHFDWNIYPGADGSTAFSDTDWLSDPIPEDFDLPAGSIIRVFDSEDVDGDSDSCDVWLIVESRGQK